MPDVDAVRTHAVALAEKVVMTCGNLRPHDVRHDFAPDAVLALPYAPQGTPTEVVGRDEIVDYISLLGGFIPPGAFADHTFDSLAGDPGLVVARYTIDTTLVSTGLPYTNRYVTLVTVRDGQVIRYEEYFNPLTWLAAQGRAVDGVAQ
ncbi:nuclear transport factor 2 family protein [Pseudonocardia xishanensis]|uniref:SnoaL-like domain-containing protein n=1 Tax=Pseudonocardia xishanensis TaxID=630995 RepID=A0ABP8RFS4_9PSEU